MKKYDPEMSGCGDAAMAYMKESEDGQYMATRDVAKLIKLAYQEGHTDGKLSNGGFDPACDWDASVARQDCMEILDEQ